MKISEFNKVNGSYLLKFLHKVSKGKIKRQLYFSRLSNITHTSRRINRIMKNKNFNYLEVGVAYGLTLEGVTAQSKIGVDPYPKFNLRYLPTNCKIFKTTSDQFFDSLDNSQKFDFIFLDGLHEINQLIRDLVNSIKIINQDSWILIDDVVPYDSVSAISNLVESKKLRKTSLFPDFIGWHGDCFKIIELISAKFNFLDSFLIIYPDNPQLLVRIKADYDLNSIQFQPLKEYYDYVETITYENFFESNNFRKLPIYIEELLNTHLLKLGLINQ